MKPREKIHRRSIKSKEPTKDRLKIESGDKSKKRVTNNERNKIIDNSELSKNNKTDIGFEENEKSYKDLNTNKMSDKAKPKVNKNFIKKKTVSYKLETDNKETKEKEMKDLKQKKISDVPQKKKIVKGPKTDTTIKQKDIEKDSEEKNLSRVELDKRMKLNDDNENNEESYNEKFNKTDDNFRKNELEDDEDNNRKILSDSLEQSFNQSKGKENENDNIDIYQNENTTGKVFKFKNNEDAKDGSDEDHEKENENGEEVQKEKNLNIEKEDKNELSNRINEDNKKVNVEQEKTDFKKVSNVGNKPKRMSIKKGKKAYSNFIQNLKKANKNKKNKMNIFQHEQKPKFVKVVNKIKVFKSIPQEKEKEKEKEKEVQTQNENQLEDPLIEQVRNEMLKENEEEQNQRQNEKDLNKEENLGEKDNINISKKEEFKDGYTGFVLLKQTQGANIFQIKFEGSLEEMNKIFKTYKIELEGGPIELIYTKDLENLRKNFQEKEEDEVLKETRNQEPFPTMKKISIEERAAKKEVNDNLKIEEMKEKIRVYKEELKKGDDIGIGLERRQRLSLHKKYNNNKEKQLAEESIPKNNAANNNNANPNINQQDENNKNKVENKKATDAPPDKKQYTKIEVEQKKDKERDKSFSRAMDRFKRRYKKDNSAEARPKKSEKINEMAKQLENVLGKANASAEINYEPNISNDIVHEDEKEGNVDEVLEKKPVISKKSKKLQQFQI